MALQRQSPLIRKGTLAQVTGIENGGYRGPRIATARVVLGVPEEVVDAFFEHTGIPVQGLWIERSGGLQAKVIDSDSAWCGLQITHYTKRKGVLFQGPEHVAQSARLKLVQFMQTHDNDD